MMNRIIKIILSITIAVIFLWFAFRGVNIAELTDRIREIKFTWILPFSLALIVSHYLRAERWRMLLKADSGLQSRPTLFAGVMMGYMLNNIFPRLGEVSRPLYVAKKTGLSTSNLLGTIVLERMIDLACVLIFLVWISIYVIEEQQLLTHIFGTDNWLNNAYLLIPGLLIVLVALIGAAYRFLIYIEGRKQVSHPWLQKLITSGKQFWKGLVSIRRLENWPLFIFWTLGIWAGYGAMAYFPLWMLDLHTIYELGITDAVVVTVISAIGMIIPTPGGVGSYHLLVQQSLWILYEVPLIAGLTYATITHAATIFFVFLLGAGTLWFDKYYQLKQESGLQ